MHNNPSDNLIASPKQFNFRLKLAIFNDTLIEVMDYKNIIKIEKGKRGGQPTIRGMRITVYDVLQWLASGMSTQEILKDFPELTEKDIKAALQFAADKEKKSLYA